MKTSLSVALILIAALSGQAGAPAGNGISIDKAAGILGLLSPGEGGRLRQQAAVLCAAATQQLGHSAQPGFDWAADSPGLLKLSAPALRLSAFITPAPRLASRLGALRLAARAP